MTDLPKLPISLGSHAAVWFIDDREIVGEFEGSAFHPPALSLFEGVGEEPVNTWFSPSEREFPRVVGRLRSGQDVVLTEVGITTWFHNRGLGLATSAVVGLNIADVPGDAYRRVRMQITGCETLFGTAPIKAISWPGETPVAGPEKYGAECDPAANLEWDDAELGMRATCEYESRFTIGDRFRYSLSFQPTIELTSRIPLTVTQWMTEWVRPLLRVATLATKQPQRLAWLMVEAAPEQPDEGKRTFHSSGLLFGSGIEQAPYEAEMREDMRDPHAPRPLFALSAIPMTLPGLLRQWRILEEGQNPFVELYGLALIHTDLPARARFLHLIQALEGLHSHENLDRDKNAQSDFASRRTETLDALTAAGIVRATLTFIRNNWSKRKQIPLAYRLEELLSQLPEHVRESLVTPEMNEIAAALAVTEKPVLPNQLQKLRNDLSHGSRNFSERALRPWVQVAEILCRANVLRLLGFDAELTEACLTNEPKP